MPPYYFLNNSVKSEPILIIVGIQEILKKIVASDNAFVYHTWKMSPNFVVKCKTRSPDRSYIVSPEKWWMALKTAGFRVATCISDKQHQKIR